MTCCAIIMKSGWNATASQLILKRLYYYVIFKPRQRIACHDFNIFFGMQLLKQANIVTFLGVYFDDHNNGKCQISLLSKPIAKSVGVIFTPWFYLSSRTKLT